MQSSPFAPAAAECLSFGSSDDRLTMALSYDLGNLEFNLDLDAHVAWGDMSVAASLSLHTRPSPKFALSLALFIPLVDSCTLDFTLEAEADSVLPIVSLFTCSLAFVILLSSRP